MNEDYSGKTFTVVDCGFFLPVARRLAESGARVYFHNPAWQKAFPSINDGILGDGIRDIKCVPDLWDVKDQTDCYVFPDIQQPGLQEELRSQGKRVWGSARGMVLETDRLFFLKKLEELGLDVPPYDVITGVTNLGVYLKDKQDVFIKMSRWRGSWETKHWRSWKQDAHHLDNWAVRFGGIKDKVRFLCFAKIETDLEIGADTYCIDGQWPSQMLHGIEAKDCAYLSAVTQREAMPEQLLPIMEAFSPFLKEKRYRSQWSMEVRVGKKGNYFIDATCRGGLPSTDSQLIALENFADIIYHGANGDFVEPEYNCKFTAECMVSIKGESKSWETIDLPEALKPQLKLYDYCEVNGQPWFPADEDERAEIGWLVATGNTPTETAEAMNALADELPDGCNAAVESLADIIRQIESEKDSGISFTSQEMPDPEVVLEES